jgi:N-acetylmuramic acid 6-phosphate (MurNAc-6-P) etherase
VTGCASEEAQQAIADSGRNVRLAVLMVKLRITRAEAERRLAGAGDNLWRVLGGVAGTHGRSPSSETR